MIWKLNAIESRVGELWFFIYRMERNYYEILKMLDTTKEKYMDANGQNFVKYTEYAQTYFLLNKKDLTKKYSDYPMLIMETKKKQ